MQRCNTIDSALVPLDWEDEGEAVIFFPFASLKVF